MAMVDCNLCVESLKQQDPLRGAVAASIHVGLKHSDPHSLNDGTFMLI